MKHYTAEELIKVIDRSLKKTAEDVHAARIPLDGRFRLPPADEPPKASNEAPKTDDKVPR